MCIWNENTRYNDAKLLFVRALKHTYTIDANKMKIVRRTSGVVDDVVVIWTTTQNMYKTFEIRKPQFSFEIVWVMGMKLLLTGAGFKLLE